MIPRAALNGLLAGVCAGLTLVGLPAGARAQDDATAGSEGALFLLLPVGAKGVSLGHAVTALDGPESVWWNPAGLGPVTEGRVILLRGEDLAGVSTALTTLFPRQGVGVLGLSYQLSDLGDLERRDDQGNFLGTISYRNHLGVLSAASEIASTLSLGLNLKLIQQRVTCRGECDDAGVTATTYALDAGVLWRSVLGLPLRLGAAVANAGPRVQVINEGQADPLPTRVRVGVAYDVLRHFVEDEDVQALFAVDLEDRWEDLGSPATHLGVEVAAGREQALVVRAGYVFGADLQVDGAGVGVGLRYERFELGIGKSLAQTALTSETEPVHLTLGVVF
jgi:hypothetical protein